jgi:methyl-accepting chemotaxis protein
VNQAIVSLQFQDMVTQLLGHVTHRLDAMAELAGDAGGMTASPSEGGESMAAIRALEAVRHHADVLLQRLGEFNKNMSANPVRQTQYASGDVELF